MEWTPFVEVEAVIPTVEQVMDGSRISVTAAEKIIRELKAARVFENSRYLVIVRQLAGNGTNPDMVWLSIKRHDQQPIHDWRDLQRIKTELVGAECEGVELYPAESRMLDAANQFHLWVFADPEFQFPFGFKDGRAVFTVGRGRAKQRAPED